MEIDLDISVGEVLVGGLDGINSLLEEVLLGLVQHDLGEGGAVESDSGPGADDDSGEEELVKEGVVDGGEGPAVGSGLGLVLLDPSGLDLPGGEDEDCLLKLLLQLSD